MKIRSSKAFLFLSLLLAAAIQATPESVSAREGEDRDRVRFTGWVEEMPEGLHGTWVIGGRDVETDRRTEFDEEDGPLRVGGCAKVDIRRGVVHEIDSEPPRDCR